MTDLLQILPAFPSSKFATLLPTIEQHGFTTTDVLALHPTDLAKHTHLPILELKRLIAVIQASLCDDLKPKPHKFASPASAEDNHAGIDDIKTVSTLDSDLDASLGGGVPLGRITEFTGESGTCKTQFLLTLCLSVQLPAPHGHGRKALYLSTESALATRRLTQMMQSHPIIQSVDFADRPSLDNILSAAIPDLESQDHIMEYQVPVLLARHDVGLIVLDSVAANYRAEFEREGNRASNMAARSAELVKLGALLRDMARRHNIAVVVANQVSDRIFSSPVLSRQPPSHSQTRMTQESPLASRSMMPPPPPSDFSSSMPFPYAEEGPASLPALRLDHQQRWFTGWGDDPHSSIQPKTPSLGLVWSTQIACRIALFKRPVYGRPRRIGAPIEADDYDTIEEQGATLKSWRRWMKVVFAPHVEDSGMGLDHAVEFEVGQAGVTAVKKTKT